MKDVIHHLKHVQKKVIRSQRHSEISENESLDEAKIKHVSTALLEEKERPKRRDVHNQLRKSFVRATLH